MKTYYLNFEGSWSDRIKHELPDYSGVYLVYRGVLERGIYTCHEILYIGQADNIRKRHANHEKLNAFLRELQPNEELFYSCAHVAKNDLDRVENVLVFDTQPRLNDKLKETFPYPMTMIVSEGQCALLHKRIIVESK